MLASRRLLLLAIGLYVVLPLPWILWRPEALFYRFDLDKLPAIALAGLVFVVGWMVGEALRLRGDRFAADAAADDPRWPAATGAILLALACSLAANLVLYSMGALTIDESTGRARIPVVTTLASAHIFALIYSGCLIFTSRAPRLPRGMLVLALLSVAATVGVGLVEGRRTAVVLPIVVYIALAIVSGRRRLLRALLWTTPVFIALVAFTTYSRTTVNEDAADIPDAAWLIAGDAAVGRLGNPLLILDPILDNIRQERQPLDPRTLQSVFADLPNFGLVNAPFETGFGNELGRDLGLLPPDNDFTGINSGWIGELLMVGGHAAVFVGAVVLAFLAASAWQLISVAHPAGLFLRVMTVIFVISGFQMEVAFPIASLVRAAAIALVLAFLERAAGWTRRTPTPCAFAG